jgi:hypothetical protein
VAPTPGAGRAAFAFRSESVEVVQVVPDSPAARAGIRNAVGLAKNPSPH